MVGRALHRVAENTHASIKKYQGGPKAAFLSSHRARLCAILFLVRVMLFVNCSNPLRSCTNMQAYSIKQRDVKRNGFICIKVKDAGHEQNDTLPRRGSTEGCEDDNRLAAALLLGGGRLRLH